MNNNVPKYITNKDLQENEEYSYRRDEFNESGIFERFRLYLPTFPRTDTRSISEIPLLLARKFAIGMENHLYNTVQLLTLAELESDVLRDQMQLSQNNKFVKVDADDRYDATLNGFNGNLETVHLLNDVKSATGSIEVEVFQNVPAYIKKHLVENTKFYIKNQCCWFVNLLSFWYFENINLCIRVTENYCLKLSQINDIFSNENDLIHCENKYEVCRFMLAEFLVAIDFLHERSIIHRLLTPDHIYFDYRGHLKIGNIYESMNASQDLEYLFETWDLKLERTMSITDRLDKNYLDFEVLNNLLKDNLLSAYLEMDCLSDIFSVAIIVIESLSGSNLLSLSFWEQHYQTLSLNMNDPSYIVNIFQTPQLQIILRQQVADICKNISPEVNGFFLSMLQPKSLRLKGLRMNVQRYGYFNSSGCCYKMRLSLVEKHPAFNGLNMHELIVQSSPIAKLLTMLQI